MKLTYGPHTPYEAFEDYLKTYQIELWAPEKIAAFQKDLLHWYHQNKRDLPWRQTSNPYAIWVSEIMLQQTQVATVIPYYQRFLAKFPTIADLAEANEDELHKIWEGLGYYSRVRNMQAAAQTMVEQYNGTFPTTYEEVISLKGIGPYTAGAIVSIAYNQPYPALDGNAMRVLARLFEIDLDIGLAKNRKVFERLHQALISYEEPGNFNQALMDLGSDIESYRGYRVEESPVKAYSAAYLNGTQAIYPIKEGKTKVQEKAYRALIIEDNEGNYLFLKRPKDGLLSNFWMVPLIEQEEDITPFLDSLGLAHYIVANDALGSVRHIFSHRHWTVDVWYVRVLDEAPINVTFETELMWLHPNEFSTWGFPKIQHKIWEQYQQPITD
ncbi:A/G-specific adenine glycosylase [Atopobacter phocae]|uniref:A/G-specific adenine glycosylase n=1 Tax=Atopobacter phocae TaxID=136492 RepID=UPI00046F02AA|nr:A/G-specific adenine glycosylase [Atopobacter phocae]